MKKATIKPASAAQILKALRISKSEYLEALARLGLQVDQSHKKVKASKHVRHASLPA